MEFIKKGGKIEEVGDFFDEAIDKDQYLTVRYENILEFIDSIVSKLNITNSLNEIEKYKLQLNLVIRYMNEPNKMNKTDRIKAHNHKTSLDSNTLHKEPDGKTNGNYYIKYTTNKITKIGHVHYSNDYAGFPSGGQNTIRSVDCQDYLRQLINFVVALFYNNFNFEMRTHFLMYFYTIYKLKINNNTNRCDDILNILNTNPIVEEAKEEAKEEAPVVYDYQSEILSSIYNEKKNIYNKNIPPDLIKFMRELLLKKQEEENFLVKKINEFLQEHLKKSDVEIYNVKINEFINKHSNTDYEQFSNVEKCKKTIKDIPEIQDMLVNCNRIVETLNNISIDNTKPLKLYMKQVLINKINNEHEQLNNLLEKYTKINYYSCVIQSILILNNLTQQKLFSITKNNNGKADYIELYDITTNKNQNPKLKKYNNVIYRDTLLNQMKKNMNMNTDENIMVEIIMDENIMDENIIDPNTIKKQIKERYNTYINENQNKFNDFKNKLDTELYTQLEPINDEIYNYDLNIAGLENIIESNYKSNKRTSNKDQNTIHEELKKLKKERETLEEKIQELHIEKNAKVSLFKAKLQSEEITYEDELTKKEEKKKRITSLITKCNLI